MGNKKATYSCVINLQSRVYGIGGCHARSKIPYSINATKQATIYCNNQGTFALAKNTVYQQRSKHIDIKYHFIRTEIQKHTIKLDYIPMEENVADLFTKPIGRTKLNKFFTALNRALY